MSDLDNTCTDRLVFYDLETTDLSPLGQILNYSFIATDQNFTIVAECSGLIRISRLQLPSPGALLANRTNPLEHQARATDTEPIALQKIASFLTAQVNKSQGRLPFIGYNSARFDLNFLRTSFIRNGIDPYIPGLMPFDLLFLSRKLCLTSASFPSVTKTDEEGMLRRTLSLENLGHTFGLLSGVQSHESRQDVVLTISLAKLYAERFGTPIGTFTSYEALSFHKKSKPPARLWSCELNYDAALACSRPVPLQLIDFDGRSALWVDLESYQNGQGKSAIRYYKTVGSQLFLDQQTPWSAELLLIAEKAEHEFAKVTLKNFFPITNCDIEADIYRLDWDDRKLLQQLIWGGGVSPTAPRTTSSLRTEDAQRLFTRFRLAHHPKPTADPHFESLLRKYSLYRYGGRAKVRKSDTDSRFIAGELSPSFHQPFCETLAELSRLKQTATGEDLSILEATERFYAESEILGVVDSALLSHAVTAEVALFVTPEAALGGGVVSGEILGGAVSAK